MAFFNRFSRNYKDIDQSTKHSLDDFINRSDNKGKCCECLSPSVTFVSITFKCVLCSRCGHAHIDNMPNSVVKSTVYKESWNKQDLKTLKNSGGNRENYKIYNGKNQPFPYDADIDKVEVDKYLRDKYIFGNYMTKVDERYLYNNICSDDDVFEDNSTSKRGSVQHSSFNSKIDNKPDLPSKPRPNTKNFNPSSAVFTGEDQFTSQHNSSSYMAEPQFTSQPKPAVFDGSFDYQPYNNNAYGYIQPDVFEKVREQQVYQQQVMTQPSNQHQEIMNMYSQPGVYQSGVEIGPNNPQYQDILNQQNLIQQQQSHQQQLQQQQLQQQQLQQQQQMMLQQQMFQQNQMNNNNGFY